MLSYNGFSPVPWGVGRLASLSIFCTSTFCAHFMPYPSHSNVIPQPVFLIALYGFILELVGWGQLGIFIPPVSTLDSTCVSVSIQ